MTLHITEFEGGNALSDFRVRQLLPRLQAIERRISGISARFVHLVATDACAGHGRTRAPRRAADLRRPLPAHRRKASA